MTAAQSRPTYTTSGVSSDNNAPQVGSDDPARGSTTGRSLTGALRRVFLKPVCDPGRTAGGGVMQALHERPTMAVTSAPAESLQRTPIGHPQKGWCPSDRRDGGAGRGAGIAS